MRLPRRWALCSPNGLGPDSKGQAGVEIAADGKYNVLVVDTANHVVPATDVRDQGKWEVVSNAPPYQVTFTRDDGAFRPIFVSFTDPPEFATMESGGVAYYVYTPLD
jgi:hypothetical protein